MRASMLAVLVTIALVIPGLVMAAGDVPDLKGTWTGHLVGMRHGKGDPVAHRADKGLRTVTAADMTLTIDFQEGRVFSGTHSSGKGKTKETVIGVIRSDNKNVVMTDDDSFFLAKLLAPDKLEVVWSEVEYPEHGAGIAIYTKKK
jgi:hypothetical protein